jgi:hypothetical protein
MSAKITATRQAAFLKAVAETGNQTLAAERAKVSRSWVLLHRKRDAGFDAAVREAVVKARETLSERPSTLRLRSGEPALGTSGGGRGGTSGTTPPSGWGHLDGVELVVRGTGGSPGARGAKRVQIARARLHQWDARVEDRFLATLAATCNVKAACAAAGMTAASAYNHRKRWRGFARRWDEAEEEGALRIEGALLEIGANLFSEPDVPAEVPIVGMTADHAIHLLHMHKHKLHGLGRAPGKGWRPPKSFEEVRPGIARKVEAIIRMRGLSEEAKARDREEFARRRLGATRED